MAKLLLSSLRFYWRSHLGVLLGGALGTAALVGSLLVGDSVDGSLRRFALQRLGGVHHALFSADRFFASDLAPRIGPGAAAVLQLRGMALADDRQVNRVQVLGCDAAFWAFGGLDFDLAAGGVALNEKLASALGVAAGDEVSLRVGKPGLLPRDAPLAAQREERTVRGRFTVARIVGDHELGRFSLSPGQAAPYNAFVAREWLEAATGLEGKANLLLAGGGRPDAALREAWSPDDFGLRFREAGGAVNLESDAIYLDAGAARAAQALPGAQGTLTYLVNGLAKGGRSTPYSFVLAHGAEGLGDDGMVVNRWLADELEAKPGDAVAMRYYAMLPPDRFEERERIFTVRRIAEMEEIAPERALAPRFPGLADVDRCADWDAGLPLDEELLEDEPNEEYWNRYGQTPKAVVSLAAGQSMWSNRFGNLTGVRWTGEPVSPAEFRRRYDPAAAGFQFRPVREEALEAVEQAMDFGPLFVGMSFFLIVAAMLLTGLLFVFGAQRRAEGMGILLAVGWRPAAVRHLLLAEGGAVALLASLAGAWLGTGYTRLLLYGLASRWEGAVARSSIGYFPRPGTLAAGALAGFACAWGAMALAAWRLARRPARELLSADFSQEAGALRAAPPRAGRLALALPAAGALAAAGVVAHALLAEVQRAALPFFAAGALLLAAGLLFFRALLRMREPAGLDGLAGLALRNAARRRGRSLAVAGLLACGSFLVFSVSSMNQDVAAHADQPWSGTGGFAWFGESTLPVDGDLGGVRLRVRDGDDASCLNLNRARAPRLLGVDPDALSVRGAFCAGEDVWALLKLELPDGMVPALAGDSDTAVWGLEARTGVERGAEIEYLDGAGRPFKVKLVGKLPMRLSVFQGALLVAERDFAARFPAEEGYRMFLLDEPVEGRRHERAGLDVAPAVERLMEFHAVESTYLAMFLVLGGLGLAVGSMGMGVVVLRNVEERSAEMALLRAVGYRPADVRRLLFLEHGLLLAAGLATGIVAALVAMAPALVQAGPQVSVPFLAGVAAIVGACALACMAAALAAALRGDPLRGLRSE